MLFVAAAKYYLKFLGGGVENNKLHFAPILLPIRQWHRHNVSQLPHVYT